MGERQTSDWHCPELSIFQSFIVLCSQQPLLLENKTRKMDSVPRLNGESKFDTLFVEAVYISYFPRSFIRSMIIRRSS